MVGPNPLSAAFTWRYALNNLRMALAGVDSGEQWIEMAKGLLQLVDQFLNQPIVALFEQAHALHSFKAWSYGEL